MTEMRDFAQNITSPFLLCILWVSPRYPTLTNVGVTSMVSMIDFFKEKIAIAKSAGLKFDPNCNRSGTRFCQSKKMITCSSFASSKRYKISGVQSFFLFHARQSLAMSLIFPTRVKGTRVQLLFLPKAFSEGAHIFRVHNVRACWETLKVISPFQPRLRVILNLAISADGKISTTGNPRPTSLQKQILNDCLKSESKQTPFLLDVLLWRLIK
jgi:hypothetical protein